jgi:hypothetical protein
MRFLMTVANLGFDDHTWLSEDDLTWLVSTGEQHLSELNKDLTDARSELARFRASGEFSSKPKAIIQKEREVAKREGEIREFSAKLEGYRAEVPGHG